jgi:hypothetical protein
MYTVLMEQLEGSREVNNWTPLIEVGTNMRESM